MSLGEAENQCYVLTVGSQDTSAALMSALIHHIAQSPSVSAKVYDEISQFEQDGKLSSPVVTYDETTKMEYFMACVYETLRFTPPVSLILPRHPPADGMYINETWISERAEIAANPYVVHRDSDIFGDDADTFWPERWLRDRDRVRLMHKYLLSFGYGNRKCLGRSIALFESQKTCLQVCRSKYDLSLGSVRLTTSKLLRDFDIRIVSPEKPYEVQNWGIQVYFKQFIQLKPRSKGGQAIKVVAGQH